MSGVIKTGFGAIVFAFALSPAYASPLFSENFDNPGFRGASLGLSAPNLTSERWLNTNYYNINNFGGWTFNSGAFLAQNIDNPADQAVLLNENNGIATYSLSGLAPNAQYQLTFNLSGDNRSGLQYVFNLDVNAVQVLTVTALWTVHDAGLAEAVYFNSDAGGAAVFKFYEASATTASPIIDNLAIQAVPEPATFGLFGAGLLGFGAFARRRKAAAEAKRSVLAV